MATANKTRKGIPTRCPFCGEEDTLSVSVSDVAQLSCTGCDSEISPDDLRRVVAQYQRLLSWLEAAPEYVAE